MPSRRRLPSLARRVTYRTHTIGLDRRSEGGALSAARCLQGGPFQLLALLPCVRLIVDIKVAATAAGLQVYAPDVHEEFPVDATVGGCSHALEDGDDATDLGRAHQQSADIYPT